MSAPKDTATKSKQSQQSTTSKGSQGTNKTNITTTTAATTSKSSNSSTIATSRTTTIPFISSSSTNSTIILPAKDMRNFGGIAAGATIAVLVVLSLIAAAIFFFVYRRKLRRSQRDASVRTRHSKLSDNTQHCNTLPRYDNIDEQFDSEMNPPYNEHTYNEVFDQIYNKAGPIHPNRNTGEASCPVDHTGSSSIDTKGSSDIPNGPIYTIASSSEQRVTASHDQQQNVNNNKNPNSGNRIQDSNNKTRQKMPLPDPNQQSSVYSLSQPVLEETQYTSPPPDSRTQPTEGSTHACENAYVELEKIDNDVNMQQDTPTYFELEKDIYPDNYK